MILYIYTHIYICSYLLLVTQSCLTPCDPMDCSPPGSTVHGILQARILEWVAKPSTRASFQPRNWTVISCVGGYIFCTHTHTHTHTYTYTHTHTHTHTHTYLGEGNVKPHHILAWRIPLTKEPGGLQSKGSQRTEHYSVTTKEHIHIHIYIRFRFLLRWNKRVPCVRF